MMFVALWRLSAIMTFVAYGVCRTIHDWFKQFRIRYLCLIRRSDEEEKPALPARRDTTSFNNFSFLCACAERIVLNIFILFYVYKWKLLRVNQFCTICFATASQVHMYLFIGFVYNLCSLSYEKVIGVATGIGREWSRQPSGRVEARTGTRRGSTRKSR